MLMLINEEKTVNNDFAICPYIAVLCKSNESVI